MKKNKFVLLVVLAAIFGSVLTGCSPKATVYDESSYIGTYYGNHYLADSANIRFLIGDQTATMVYPDTLIVTNGTSATDGKIIATSSLLAGGNIEINISNGAVTPIDLGDISILGTTLQYTKLKSGSTGIWNSNKSIVNTHLVARATYNYSGTPINLEPININGIFNKQ